jgi:type II secretory pathway component GspD/PulD (secretin)
LDKSIVLPAGFQTRGMGVILNVTPTLAQNGRDIDLVLLPQIVYELIWKDYSSAYIDASGRQQQVKMEQPFFSSRNITTALTIENGSTVLAGGGLNIKNDDKEVIYVFVSARTVDGQGKPVK